MISALATGRLVTPVSFGQTKSEKAYARATIACDVGAEQDMMISLFTMDPESIAALERSKKGDTIAGQGQLSPNDYVAKDGTKRTGFALAFCRVLTAAGPKRERKERPAKPDVGQYKAAARAQRNFDDLPSDEPW